MDKVKYKLGVLGCGMIGKSFIRQGLEHNDYQIVAICGKNELTLHEAALLAPTAKLYLNKQKFFEDPDIDAIVVCTPHAQHAIDAMQAIRYGKHVLIEKPIATNLQQLLQLLEISHENPNIIVTGLPHGQYSFIKEVHELLSYNAIGKITSIHSILDVPGPPRANWYYQHIAIGGASLDTFPYALVRTLQICQIKLTTAIGLINQLVTHRICGDGEKIKTYVDDNAILVGLLSTGQQITVRSNWNVSSVIDCIVIHGRQGTISIDAWKNTIEIHTNYQLNPDKYLQIGSSIYNKKLSDPQPEYLKLNVFMQHIKRKSGNLKEIAYAMQFILLMLQGYKEIKPVLEFYVDREISSDFVMLNEYV